MSPSRAAGRRIAEALLDPLVRGVRAVTRRGAPQPAPVPAPVPAPAPAPVPAPAPAPVPVAEVATAGEPGPRASAPAGDAAAARIDAARERLRSRIAPPTDEDPPPLA